MPGWTQLASIASSFLTATIGPAEDFLVARQNLLMEQAESNSSEPVEYYTVMTLGKKLPLLGTHSVVQCRTGHCIVVQ